MCEGEEEEEEMYEGEEEEEICKLTDMSLELYPSQT